MRQSPWDRRRSFSRLRFYRSDPRRKSPSRSRKAASFTFHLRNNAHALSSQARAPRARQCPAQSATSATWGNCGIAPQRGAGNQLSKAGRGQPHVTSNRWREAMEHCVGLDVSLVICSTSGFADRGSLALDGVAPLAHHSRRATHGPVAGRGAFWQFAARAYALPDIRLLPQESATRPEASPYRAPLPDRSKLGSDGSLVRGSPAHFLLPMRTRTRDQRAQRRW